ncbi:MAG: hypothetical protein ACSHYB_14650 [Roseibacillus sp.]
MKLNSAFPVSLLSLFCASFCELKASASFNFSPSAGTVESFVLFELEDEAPLAGGYLFAGTYASLPDEAATNAELLADFTLFGSLSTNPSGASGFFSAGQFSGDLGGLPSSKIYLLVTDSLNISTATQFAVFSSSLSSWTFPVSELDASVSISLPAVDQYFAGSPDTLSAGNDVFNSIQLTAVAEPEPLVLPSVCFVISAGRPGIEFEFPTAQAGQVQFVLQESEGDTLLESDWIDVVASPSVVSDDGTTQVIRIVHPALLSSDTQRFFRLLGV